MNRSVCAFALLGFVLACEQSTEPLVLPPSTPNATGAVTYFAAQTVVRQSGAKQTVEFALDEHDHSLFMEPFVLHIQLGGGRAVVGTLLVDGLAVLDRRHFAAIGIDPYALEVTVTPTTVITVELEGDAGGSLTFRVDAPPQPAPVITITSPARHTAGTGAVLEQGSLAVSDVNIAGTACHPRYPITQLEIAGVSVPVAGNNLCEPFTVAQQSRWGMSVITGRARNARGREGTVVQAYTRSPEHYAVPVSGSLTTSVRGLFSHLSQAALDDGSRTDLDDLASLFKRVIDQSPIVIPAITAVACNDVFEVRIPQQQPQLAVVINSFTAHTTDLTVDISITNPSITVSVRADANPLDGDCDGALVENGTFSASSVRITANLDVASAPAGQAPRITVSLSQPNVTVTGASATSTSAAADALLSGLTAVSASLLNSFIGQFVLGQLAPAMSGLLNGFVPALSRDVSLNAATVRVASGFSTVLNGGVAPNGFLRIGLYGLVSPVTQLAGAIAPRGPLRALCGAATPCPGSQVPIPPFNLGANTFAVAVHQDLLNQTLWSAWRAGAFVLSEPPLSLNATMPPVSMATASGDPMGEFQWGDVRVTATFDPADLGQPPGAPIVVECWVSATVRGAVQFDNATRVLALSGVTLTIEVELIGPTLPFDDAVVRAAIADRLRAPLTVLTRDAFAVVPLPQGEPRLVNAAVTRNGFFYLLTGSLQ